ncbi:MAG: competence protein ComK [Bacilli bacterium]|nr:competence protein ComK [Bacilli bacterium]MDD4607560.1 competence protein ComK [Bacilli bacterium]
MRDSYEINRGTLAIIPVTDKISQVIEDENQFLVRKSTTKIIDESCKFFGSSYLGRKDGTKRLIGVTYKAPIIVCESSGIIFFPTSSPRFDNCHWISLNNLKDYTKHKTDINKCIVTFKNDKEIQLNLSFFILENQIYRATMLESKLMKLKTA